MNKDELDDLKKMVSVTNLPSIGNAPKATLDATKMSPALKTLNIAFGQSIVSPAWIEMSKKICNSVSPLALWAEENQARINKVAESVRNVSLVMDKTLLQIAKQWEQSWAPMFQSLNRDYQARLESYPNLAPRIEMLAKQGWFVSMYFGLHEFDQIASEALNVDCAALEEFLETIYRGAIEEHADSIIQEYPDREFSIVPALNAHLRGEYALSVPVFLAQADGICTSTVGKYLFHGRPGSDNHITCWTFWKSCAWHFGCQWPSNFLLHITKPNATSMVTRA